MWSSLAPPGKLTLISGPRSPIRAFHQELAHDALHTHDGCMLWLDGEHGFNPYDFAELNLSRGFDADWGAQRLLVKRCMTPFQWDTVLTKHLREKLLTEEACLVLAAPYDTLFSTDELQDWEREDYVNFSLRHLKSLAAEHQVPIVLSVDMAEWCHKFPLVAWSAYEAVDARWEITPTGAGWTATQMRTGLTVDSAPMRQATLAAFGDLPEVPAPAFTATAPPRREASADRWITERVA